MGLGATQLHEGYQRTAHSAMTCEPARNSLAAPILGSSLQGHRAVRYFRRHAAGVKSICD